MDTIGTPADSNSAHQVALVASSPKPWTMVQIFVAVVIVGVCLGGMLEGMSRNIGETKVAVFQASTSQLERDWNALHGVFQDDMSTRKCLSEALAVLTQSRNLKAYNIQLSLDDWTHSFALHDLLANRSGNGTHSLDDGWVSQKDIVKLMLQACSK